MKSVVAQVAGLLFGMLVVTFILHPERFGWWQTYKDPGGSFSLEFPSKPRAADQQVKTRAGGTAVLKMVGATPNTTTRYIFLYLDVPGPAKGTAEEELNSARDGAISSVHGALLDEQRIQVDSHEARDIQARSDVGLIFNMRIIADGQRRVILEVDTAAGQTVDSKNVQKFFDSLKLSK